MKLVTVYTLGESSKTLNYENNTTFNELKVNFTDAIGLEEAADDFRFFLITKSLRCLIDPSQKVSTVINENNIHYPPDPKDPRIVLSRVFFMRPYNEEIPIPSTLHELIYAQCVHSLLSYSEWANTILSTSVEECIRVSAIIAVSKYGSRLEGTGLVSNKMKENILNNIILGSKIPVMKGDSKYVSIRSLLKDSTWEAQIQKVYNDVCSEVRILNPANPNFTLSAMSMIVDYCKSHLIHYGTEFTSGTLVSIKGGAGTTGQLSKYSLPLKISVGVSVNGVSFLTTHQEKGSRDPISVLFIGYENLAGWGVEGTKLMLKGNEPSSKQVNEYSIESIGAQGILYMLIEYVNRHVAEKTKGDAGQFEPIHESSSVMADEGAVTETGDNDGVDESDNNNNNQNNNQYYDGDDGDDDI